MSPFKPQIKFSKKYKLSHIQFTLKTIFYFKDNSIKFSKRKSHHYILLPTIKTDYLFFVLITSQIEKRKILHQTDKKALSSLVYISPKDINAKEIFKESVIDCNYAVFGTKEDLESKIVNEEFLLIDANISKDLITKLIDAIEKSPIMKDIGKVLIDKNYNIKDFTKSMG